MRHTASLQSFYDLVIKEDRRAIMELFGGPVAINTPLSGAIDGQNALASYIEKEGGWLRERVVSTKIISTVEDKRRVAIELVIDLKHEARAFDLPVAIIGQKAGSSFGQIRIYHSTWPINGNHAYRAPIVWPGEELDEPEVIERYFRDIGFPDKSDVLSLFTEDAYIREPSGSAYKHKGTDARQRFYDGALDSGPVGLTHATAIFDGKIFAVEYICDSWGPMTFDPMAGCAFYELSEDQRYIEAARIYDDVSPPKE